METDVELIFFTGCPNVESARDSLRTAFEELGRAAAWQEWDLEGPGVPERVRGFASPAILVGGRHVLGEEPGETEARACSARGAPSAAAIVEALRRAADD